VARAATARPSEYLIVTREMNGRLDLKGVDSQGN
jgi:hypothetical protein